MAPPSSLGSHGNDPYGTPRPRSQAAPTSYDMRPYAGHYAPVPPPPPAKTHGLRNVLLSVLAVLVLLAIAGGVWSANHQGDRAAAGDNKSAGDKKKNGISFEDAHKVPGQDSMRNDNVPGGSVAHPLTITPGKAFSIGAVHYSAGWKVNVQPLMSPIESLSVTNASDNPGPTLVTITVYRGAQKLSSSMCSAPAPTAGTSAPLSCVGLLGDITGYDRITIHEMA